MLLDRSDTGERADTRFPCSPRISVLLPRRVPLCRRGLRLRDRILALAHCFNLRIPHRPPPCPEDHERRRQDDREEEPGPRNLMRLFRRDMPRRETGYGSWRRLVGYVGVVCGLSIVRSKPVAESAGKHETETNNPNRSHMQSENPGVQREMEQRGGNQRER